MHAFDLSGHHIFEQHLTLRDSENNLEFAMLGECMSLLIDVTTDDIMNVSFLFCFVW